MDKTILKILDMTFLFNTDKYNNFKGMQKLQYLCYHITNMVAFLIVVGVIIVGIITGVLIYKHNQKIKALQRAYVKENSAKLKALNEINSKYSFFNPEQRDLLYKFNFNSKKAFDNFNYSDAIRSIFFNKRLQIKSLMDKVTKDRNRLKLYKEEVKKLPLTSFNSLPKDKHINNKVFTDLEKEYVSKAYLNIGTTASVTVHWSYKSPAGRNYYENHRTFGYDKIVELYFNYFNEDLRKVEENERISNSINSVIEDLNKDVYTLDEIIALFDKYDVKATKSIVESTLFKASFVKRNDSDYYVHTSVKNVRDMILISANGEGLITYNNKIKDKDYDNAIDKLEREGRIIPIDNLHFLKVSKTLCYKGITLETIDEYESLLLKFAKKETFIGLKQIYDNIDCLVTRVEFDECFVLTISKYCGFLNQVPGIDKLFTTIQRPQRIMFLEWLLKSKKSVNAYDLIYDLKKLYGVEYSIYSILYDLGKNKTDLYYNPETEKLYSNKEYFFEELEDVL